jgi:hypothetical protein
LDGRAALLRRSGTWRAPRPLCSGARARVGNLYDHLVEHAVDGGISAGFLLATLLRALGPIWPSRLVLEGVPLGDCWKHPAARAEDPGDPTEGSSLSTSSRSGWRTRCWNRSRKPGSSSRASIS